MYILCLLYLFDNSRHNVLFTHTHTIDCISFHSESPFHKIKEAENLRELMMSILELLKREDGIIVSRNGDGNKNTNPTGVTPQDTCSITGTCTRLYPSGSGFLT